MFHEVTPDIARSDSFNPHSNPEKETLSAAFYRLGK